MIAPEISELLSAYCDGEVTAAERTQAEALLAQSAECRQLLAELQAVRQQVRALPRLQLGDRFAASVLAAIERAEPTAVGDAPLTPARGLARWRRPLTWAAVAIAASLAVLYFGSPPQQPDGDQVAVDPVEPPRDDRPDEIGPAPETLVLQPDPADDQALAEFWQQPPSGDRLLAVALEIDETALRDGAWSRWLAQYGLSETAAPAVAAPTEGPAVQVAFGLAQQANLAALLAELAKTPEIRAVLIDAGPLAPGQAELAKFSRGQFSRPLLGKYPLLNRGLLYRELVAQAPKNPLGAPDLTELVAAGSVAARPMADPAFLPDVPDLQSLAMTSPEARPAPPSDDSPIPAERRWQLVAFVVRAVAPAE